MVLMKGKWRHDGVVELVRKLVKTIAGDVCLVNDVDGISYESSEVVQNDRKLINAHIVL